MIFPWRELHFSDETAEAIDDEIRKIIGDSHAEAKKLLREHRKQLDALVEALLKHETLDEQEVLDLAGLPAAPQLRDGILPLPTSNGRGRRSRSISNGSKACQ